MVTGTRPKYGILKDAKRVVAGAKPFIAWDGEGEHQKGKRGKYLLFGASTGQDISADGLRASQCFELMIQVAKENPSSIHVAFAFNYDVTMIIASLPDKVRERVSQGKAVWYKHWRIENLTRKWFKLYDKKQKVGITIYDIFTFFGCSALQAWREYLPGDTDLELVITGKGQRSVFTYNDLPFLRKYMHRELILYVRLIEKLRTLLYQLDVRPRGWYGPGAVASAFLNHNKIKNVMSRSLPDEVLQASQHAYFGGRFEQYKTGIYHGKVYKSDIRSAYPHALRTVPNLAGGVWHHELGHRSSDTTIVPFALYRVRFRGNGNPHTIGYHTRISPFPYRDFRGLIHYPREVDGWYWGIEVITAKKHAQQGELEILEAWIFEDISMTRPFKFIAELFDQRAVWKREKNPVQLAAKLCLNSIYGKLAQRVGFNEETMTPPTWHQLEFAGYTTAYCRSMVYDAMMNNPDSIIAVETDGIFSTAPLDLPADEEKLGDWEVETYDGIAYVQSGVYVLCEYGYMWRGRKMRGFSKGDFSVSDVLAKCHSLEKIIASTHRFAALKGYHGDERLTQFLDNHHVLSWGGGGKRAHDPELCLTCIEMRDGMHECYIVSGGGYSEKHLLPWRTDNRETLLKEINAYLQRSLVISKL